MPFPQRALTFRFPSQCTPASATIYRARAAANAPIPATTPAALNPTLAALLPVADGVAADEADDPAARVAEEIADETELAAPPAAELVADGEPVMFSRALRRQISVEICVMPKKEI